MLKCTVFLSVFMSLPAPPSLNCQVPSNNPCYELASPKSTCAGSRRQCSTRLSIATIVTPFGNAITALFFPLPLHSLPDQSTGPFLPPFRTREDPRIAHVLKQSQLELRTPALASCWVQPGMAIGIPNPHSATLMAMVSAHTSHSLVY